MEPHYLAIEGGGTKFIVAHGNSLDNLQDRRRIATRTPEETMHDVITYLKEVQAKHNITAIGLAVFGPIELNPQSPDFGKILNSSKQHWRQYNILDALKAHTDSPIGLESDVNGAALGEHRWGAAQGLTDFLYITVGTGIGVGAFCHNQLVHGALHPEMGHIFIPHNKETDPFDGSCTVHKNCFEGLASGPSLKERWKVNSALDLPEDHPAWDLEAHYLALGITNYTFCFAPQRIILGGGVMQQTHLIDKIRRKTQALIANYFEYKEINAIDSYITQAKLGSQAGIAGALALAELAAMKN